MNGHFPKKLGYLLKIKSWKGRMGEATICNYPELDPKAPFRSFPSDSVGLVLGVTKPAGQHGDRWTVNQTSFLETMLPWTVGTTSWGYVLTYLKLK